MKTVSWDMVYRSLIGGFRPVYGSITPLSSPHARTHIEHRSTPATPTHPTQLDKELSQRRYNYPSLPAVVVHNRPPYRRRRAERRPQSTLKDKGSCGVGGPRPRGRTDRRPPKGTVLPRRTVIPHIPADLAVTDRWGDTALVRCASGRPRAVDPQATNDMPHGRTDDATEHSTDDHHRARANAADKKGTPESDVNSGEIDAELDPWLATHAGDDYTNNECPRCGEDLLRKDKEVISEHGTAHPHISAAPNTAACYCPGCWHERKTIVKKRESTSLTDFGVRIDNHHLDDFDGEQRGGGE